MNDKELKDWQENMLLQYGWYTLAEKDVFHTHGIADKWGLPDLQIVVPMELEMANDIFFSIVSKIREGFEIKDGSEIECVIKGYRIGVVSVFEQDRQVFRVIIPDECGHWKKDEINDTLRFQYEEH
jgi:hypothetical protein